jgi:RNA polymerase sigma-70 factor (ECF subfamily)
VPLQASPIANELVAKGWRTGCNEQAVAGHLGRDADDEGCRVTDRADRERFTGFFDAHHDAIRDYALRRAERDVAEDVVAETFMTAWRRIGEVPAAPGPWLYGVARRTLANKRRSAARGAALTARVGEQMSRHGETSEEDFSAQLCRREDLRAVLASLSERDRELLLLVAWEGLDARAAGAVLGCSAATVGVRLHRARRRFARAWAEAGHTDRTTVKPDAMEAT